MAKLSQEQVDKGLSNALEDNPELLDAVAEKAAEKAAESVPVDELKAQLTDVTGDEAEAEKSVEKIRGNAIAFKGLDKSEQLSQMKAAFTGKGPTEAFQKSKTKWYFGDQSRNLQRLANGQDKTTPGEKILAEMTNEMVKRGQHNSMWPNIESRLENKGYQKAANIVKSGLEAGDLSAGGAMVPDELAEEIIEFNFANAPVRQFDVRVVDISSGSFQVPKFGGRIQTGWGGETEAISVDNPDTERRSLDAKKLTVLVPVSNDLLRRAVDGMQDQLLQHIQRALGVDETLGVLRGKGSNGEPTGIKKQIKSENKFARLGGAGSTATAEEILQTLGKAKNEVDDSNLNADAAGWIMTDRTVNGIMFQDVNDGIYPKVVMQLMDGELINKPVRTSNALPTNLDQSGQGTDDETEIYYGVWDQLYIGDTLDMEVTIRDGAAYTEGGNVKSGLSRDETLVRVIHEMDAAVAYDQAFSVVEEVDFGADAFS